MEELVVGTIISLFVFICSAILVILGWDIIYGNAQKIASRNELFSRKTAIITEINSLTKSATQFWETAHTEKDKSHCLMKTSVFTAEIESIKQRIMRLQRYGLETELSQELRTLRKSITLNSEMAFDIEDTIKQDKISNIISSSDALKYKLSTKFESLYGHVNP